MSSGGRLKASMLVLAILLGACVSSSTGTSRSTPTPSISVSVVAMGTKAQTRAGNDVTVSSYQTLGSQSSSSVNVLVAAHVEVCATTHATAVSRTLFFVQTGDRTLHPSVADVKKPALRAGLINTHQCRSGWVTFSVPRAKKKTFVVLVSSTAIKWQIP